MLIHTESADLWTIHDEVVDSGAPKDLYIFMRGERGFAPLIAARSLECYDQENIVGYFMSKLSNEDPFNAWPNYHSAGWILYQHEDALFLEVSTWMIAEPGNQSAWLYAYGQVRDTIGILKEVYPNLENLVMLGSTGFNGNLGLDQPEEITEYDFREMIRDMKSAPSRDTTEALDIIFPSPLWLFCHLWVLSSESHNATTVLVPALGSMVDEENADLIIGWFGQQGLVSDKEKRDEIITDLTEMIESVDTDALVQSIMETPRPADKNVGGAMFG